MSSREAVGVTAPAVPTVSLADIVATVNNLGVDGSDSGLIDQLTTLERIKSACAAAQAQLTHAFAAQQTAEAAARDVDADLTRRSIAGQIALARRDARHHGQRHVGVAQALVTEMPHTLAALRNGDISERRARIIIEQFACLTPADRSRADNILRPDLSRLGDRTAQTAAAAIAYRLDPEAVMGKIRGATKDRHVTLRPAPDTMTRLSALLPVAQGVAVYAALRKTAGSITATAAGDGRTRGQIMADELVSLVTGHTIVGCDPYGAPHYRNIDTDTDETLETSSEDAASDRTSPAGSASPARSSRARRRSRAGRRSRRGGGLEVNLIMTDRTLFGDDDEPAHLTGHGPIPAPLARALVIGNADTTTRTWIRRLYTNPTGDHLLTMDSQRRLFPTTAQKFLLLRDQTCRTPWCDAPIRHHDHITPHHRGGPTDISNGQGLCQACNLTKQAPLWRNWTDRDDTTVHTVTPTGHHYTTGPPPPPKSPPWPDISSIEDRLAVILLDIA